MYISLTCVGTIFIMTTHKNYRFAINAMIQCAFFIVALFLEGICQHPPLCSPRADPGI